MANLLTTDEARFLDTTWSPSGATRAMSSAQFHSGAESLQVTISAANQGINLIRQIPDLSPGVTYVHGFWVRAGTGSGVVRSYISYHKADGTLVTDNPGPTFTPIASWVPVRSEVLAPALTSYAVIWVWWDAGGNGTYFVDDCVFAPMDPTWRLHNKPSSFHQGRRSRGSLIAVPGVRGGNELQVVERQAGRNLSVDVLGGAAYILGTDISQQGHYYVESDSKVNVPFTDADPVLPRITSIFAQVVDAQFSSFAGPPTPNSWGIVAIDGTPASSPVAPATPASSIPLADVLVSRKTRAIAHSNITDRRTKLQTQGPQIYTLDGSNILLQAATGPWILTNQWGWAQGWGFIPYAQPFPNKTISVVTTDTGPWHGDGRIRVFTLPGQARNGFWVAVTYNGQPYRGWLLLRYSAIGQ